MPDTEPKQDPESQPKGRHRVLRTVAVSVAAAMLVVLVGGVLVYRKLDSNIEHFEVPASGMGSDRPSELVNPDAPQKPLNILVLGSDTRKGQKRIGGETPGLSDTSILLHLSGDRKHAYGVSLPRDAMVERPPCERKNGKGTDPGGLSMFNAAYAVGGPICTIKTVEQLTDIRVNHVVVIDFTGFKKMVDALGGVEVCVPKDVNDTTGNIQLPKGTYTVKGQQALDYVRVRHDIGTVDNGDIGRMKRQQAFMASMANKAVSAGTLFNPAKLYNFLDAATKSVTTDSEIGSLRDLVGLIRSFEGIGLDQIQFLSVPFEPYPADPNRLQWTPKADRLWDRIRNDEPLGRRFSGEVTTAASKDGRSDQQPSAKASPTQGASQSPSQSPSKTAAVEQKRAENGLCT